MNFIYIFMNKSHWPIYILQTIFHSAYMNLHFHTSFFSPIGWWSMAQLAAQDYFTRLQASGLSPFPHPDLASAFPGMAGLGASAGQGSGGGVGGVSGGPGGSGGSGSRNEPKPSKSRKKDKSNPNNSGGNMGQGSGSSAYKVCLQLIKLFVVN